MTMTPNITTMPRTIIHRRIHPAIWVIGSIIMVPLLFAFLCGAFIGIYQGITGDELVPGTMPAHSSTVKDFNEGFADSKQDDCQQGFAPACAWLEAK